jgi:DUF1680 family protein
LGKYIYSHDKNDIWIHQYVSSETTINETRVKIKSGLPWNGKVKIQVTPETKNGVNLRLRKPSWAKDIPVIGYDPRDAEYESIAVRDDKTIELDFDMSIRLRRAHPRVKGHAGKVAVTRGPLVYCLESVDNPEIELFTAQLDPASLRDEFVPELLGGCVLIHGRTMDGKPLKFIPYFLWGNRGESQMTVWVNSN